jgi:hypothetical protein
VACAWTVSLAVIMARLAYPLLLRARLSTPPIFAAATFWQFVERRRVTLSLIPVSGNLQTLLSVVFNPCAVLAAPAIDRLADSTRHKRKIHWNSAARHWPRHRR